MHPDCDISPEFQAVLIYVRECHTLSVPVHQNLQQDFQLQPKENLSLAV